MSVISLPPGVPGIRSLLTAYPETAPALLGLAQAVLRGPSTLTPFVRELLATVVSAANGCAFCAHSHGATARALADDPRQVDAVLAGGVPNNPLVAALVVLAREIAASASEPSAGTLAAARAAGATDRDLHDAVLVAATFSLFNRYVNGLGTEEAPAPAYEAMGRRLAEHGYHATSGETEAHRRH